MLEGTHGITQYCQANATTPISFFVFIVSLSCRLFTTEAWVRCQDIPRVVCGEGFGTGRGFSQNSSIFDSGEIRVVNHDCAFVNLLYS